MSTTPSLETAAKPVGQDPSSDSNTGQAILSETKLEAIDKNVSEKTTVTTTDEENGSPKPQVLPLNVQMESNDSSVQTNSSTESKVTSTDNMASIAELDSKMPEVNKTEKNVQVEECKKENQETSGNSTNISTTAETTNDSTTSNDKKEIIQTDTKNKTENIEKAENSVKHNEDSAVVNENSGTQEETESENLQQSEDTDTSECVNIQELTDHVMNILNDDGMVENVMSEQQLLKKNIDLQQFIVKLIHLLKEKTDLCANLDRQNSALISQAKSLKDVIAITKDLLGIRNMEIEHLHADMAAIEDSIKEERNRHNLSVQRLSEAMSLNDKLKTEYLTQMDLFQKLREKYNEKVVYLTKENQRLNGLLNPNVQAAEAVTNEMNAQAAEAITNEMNDQSNQIESVDK